MADNDIDSPAEQSVEDWAAGLNFTGPVLESERAPTGPALVDFAAQQHQEAVAAEETRIKEEEAHPYSWADYGTDVWNEELTKKAWDHFTAPAFEPDEAFSDARYDERLKAVQESGQLPPEWLEELEGATSDKHFDFLLGKATETLAAQQRINSTWSGLLLGMGAKALDPVTLLTGSGALMAAGRLGTALALGGGWAQRSFNAGFGAAHALGTVAAEDALGSASQLEDYLMAAGIGGVFSGTFGPITKNPTLRSTAAKIGEMGAKSIRKAHELRAARMTAEQKAARAAKQFPNVAPLSEATAAKAATNPVVESKPIADPPRPAEPSTYAPAAAPVEEAPGTTFNWKRRSLQAVLVKDGREALDTAITQVKDEDLPALMEAQRVAIDPATPPDKIRAAISEAIVEKAKGRFAAASDAKRGEGGVVEDKFKGISSKADDVVQEAEPQARPHADLEELEATDAHTKNPRFVVRYRGGDDAEYQILAETSDMSGPYKVLRDGKPIARQIDTVEEARAAIPRKELVEKPSEAHAADDIVEEADPAIDPETVNARIAELETQLKGVVDEDTATQIKDAIETLREHLAPLVDDALPNNSTTGAQAVSPGISGRPDFIESGTPLARLREDDVPYPAMVGKRYDGAGWWGRTKNAYARLGFNKLVNNVVGMKDNVLNTMSVNQDVDQLFAKYLIEYNQMRKGQFRAWGDAMGYGRIQRLRQLDEFEHHISIAMRDAEFPANIPAEARAAIERIAAAGKRYMDESWADMNNPHPARGSGASMRSLPGAERDNGLKDYLPRRWLGERVKAGVEAFGIPRIYALFRRSIQSANPDIEERYLDRLARGFVDNVVNRSYGLGDEWTIAMREGDRDRFAALLRNAQFADDEIDYVMGALWDARPTPESPFQHLKHRVLLDESIRDAGGLGITDFMDTNATALITNHARRVAGRVALARMQLRLPDRPTFRSVMERTADGRTISRQEQTGMQSGELLLDGIRTPGDIERFIEDVKAWGAQAENRSAHSPGGRENFTKQSEYDAEQLRWIIDRLLGNPNPDHMGTMGTVVRPLKNFNFIRLMWQSAFPQIGEWGNLIGSLGLRAAFTHAPAFRKIIDASGKQVMASEFYREIQGMGLGSARLHGLIKNHAEYVEDIPFAVPGSSIYDRASSALETGVRFTAEGSGMMKITEMQELHAAGAMAQKLADIGHKIQNGGKLTGGEHRRLNQLGLSKENLDAIFANMRQHVSYENGVMFKGKIARLNAQNWEPEARYLLERALYRTATKVIQSNDIGSLAIWMHKPFAQAFWQFRTFTLSAYANNLLYNIQMRDPAAILSAMWSMAWAAAARVAKVGLVSTMVPNGQEYRDKHLAFDDVAKNAFQYAGFSSIIPMLVDTGAVWSGYQGVFDGRYSGSSSNLAGNPSLALADNLRVGVAGTINSLATGREMSQAEWRAWQQAMPGGTFLPLSSLLAHMIEDKPRRAPAAKPLPFLNN